MTPNLHIEDYKWEIVGGEFKLLWFSGKLIEG